MSAVSAYKPFLLVKILCAIVRGFSVSRSGLEPFLILFIDVSGIEKSQTHIELSLSLILFSFFNTIPPPHDKTR